jgi:DNA modification methylase
VRNNSAPGGLVYEPFSGSGTTVIAGEQLGRRVRAMELWPPYVDVAVTRWESFTGNRAILAAGGKERAAVAAERGIKIAA